MKLLHPLKTLLHKSQDIRPERKVQYFDYYKVARERHVPENVVKDIEKSMKQEFPHDTMLYELHVLRAIKNNSWEKTGN